MKVKEIEGCLVRRLTGGMLMLAIVLLLVSILSRVRSKAKSGHVLIKFRFSTGL